MTPELRERIENTIRFLAVDAVERAGCGHPGAPMGLARPAFELWDRHLRFDPSDPSWPLRDRFVLSERPRLDAALQPAAPVRLRPLARRSHRLPAARLEDAGPPEYGDDAGRRGDHRAARVRASRTASGWRWRAPDARALRRRRRGPGPHFVYGIVERRRPDGGHLERGRLARGSPRPRQPDLPLRRQPITIDGPTSISFSEDVGKRFEAQRWQVQRVDGEGRRGAPRGHLESRARAETERPSLIITRTTIGLTAAPNRAGKSEGPRREARRRRGEGSPRRRWAGPLEPEFLVPDDVRAYFAERGIEAKRAATRKPRPTRRSTAGATRTRTSPLAWDAARAGACPTDLEANQLVEGIEGSRQPDAQARRRRARATRRRDRALPGRRLGGPGRLCGAADPEGARERGLPGAAGATIPSRAPTSTSACASTRWAAISNGIALDGTLPALLRHLPHLQRLHAAVDPARRADGA